MGVIKQWRISKELQFWLIISLLNFLLFVPSVMFDTHHSVLPNFAQIEGGNWYSYFKFLFIRPQSDPFRWSLDFLVLSFVLSNVSRFKLLFYSFLCFLFFLFIGYQFYASFFELVYFQTPLFYNDWSVLKTGFGIVYQGLDLRFAGLILLLLLLIYLLFNCFKYLFYLKRNFSFGKWSKIFVGLFVLLTLVNFKYGLESTSSNVFQWQTLQIGTNIKNSFDAKNTLALLDIDSLVASSQSKGKELDRKPNLYFIAIESYGKVWLDHQELKASSVNWLKGREEAFKNRGWKMVSNLSESPITGGLSWIAYSNFSYGFDFKNQGTYDVLLQDTAWYQYEDLFSRLQKNGYFNCRIMPLYQTGRMVIPWEKYTRFYHVDEWITYNDLNYSGELYGFGPAVPDQYTFNFSCEILKKHDGPLSLFFLTVSSHNPFKTAEFEADWRVLNESERSAIDGANLLSTPTIEDYDNAIQYEWLSIAEFMEKNKDDNAVYVVFGDHQPPFICDENDGFETPMHVFSKNDTLLESFKSKGFIQGMIPPNKSTFHHEDFYPLFWKAMVETFGKKELQ